VSRTRLLSHRKDTREPSLRRTRRDPSSRGHDAPALGAALVLPLILLSGCASADKKIPPDIDTQLVQVEEFMAREKYFKSRILLQELLQIGITDKDLNAKAQIALADAYFHDGGTLNLAEALARYTNFLAFNPLHARADYVQYQIGMCHFKQVYSADKDQAQTHKAMEEFRKVAALYPASSWVAEADARTREARQLLAQHEFIVGRFYADRKAHMAAIDRYRVILDRFPRYEDKPKVYYHLAKELESLDRDEEARAYLKLLIANYPEHEVTTSARDMLRKLDRKSPEPAGIADVVSL
jgi:outer membrane protein assembly factor BamD